LLKLGRSQCGNSKNRSRRTWSTASELLQGALDDYRKAEANLIAYRSKTETAQRQAQASIDDFDTSEGAASTKLAHAQVLNARLKSRELEMNESLDELSKATTQASHELNALIREKWFQRRDTIGRRGCEAMSIPLKSLELGELDTVLALSEPLNAVRKFEVAIYNAQYIERITQKAVQFVTTNIGDREVLEEIATDREPQLKQELDIDHLISSAEQMLKNFSGLDTEMGRTI
jgi:hypothetical protein